MITARQSRAARALLGWTQEALADLIAVADTIAGIKAHTGRNAPSVIT